ncbi:hypothetical protein DL98DRAFT_108551 [Cadophora sp. DSE1049]|nr:hypothetical protein DL98DRAFT_108551 [Cadophora sp. DSE1049]
MLPTTTLSTLSVVSSSTSLPTSSVSRTSSPTAIDVPYATISTTDGGYHSMHSEIMTRGSATALAVASGTTSIETSTLTTLFPSTLDQQPTTNTGLGSQEVSTSSQSTVAGTAKFSLTSELSFTDTIHGFPITQMPVFSIMTTEPDPDSRTLGEVSPASSIRTDTDSSHASSAISQATPSATMIPGSIQPSISAPRTFTSTSTMFVDAGNIATVTSRTPLPQARMRLLLKAWNHLPRYHQQLLFPLELE